MHGFFAFLVLFEKNNEQILSWKRRVALLAQELVISFMKHDKKMWICALKSEKLQQNQDFLLREGKYDDLVSVFKNMIF